LTVVTTPPSAATAWKTTAYSGVLGAQMATNVARADPPGGDPAERAHLAHELRVRQGPAARPVDQRGAVAARLGALEHERREGDVGRRDVGQRAAEDMPGTVPARGRQAGCSPVTPSLP
jgi:hypothetical protein